jgi:hypothetical protein
MTTTIERQSSRKGRASRDKASEVEYLYVVRGAADEAAALAAVSTEAPWSIVDPATSVALYRGPITWEQNGPAIWEVTVSFQDPQRQEKEIEVGEYRVSFSTTGGTQHIAASLATVARYAPAGKVAPIHNQAIGVSDNGEVQGCDIVVPSTRYTVTYRQPLAIMTDAYVRTVISLTGTVNNATWKGRAAGSVLFMGADGLQATNSAPEVTYHFAEQPNLTGLTIGAITGIAKKGWEYLWVEFEELEDPLSKRLVKKPRAVHVEQVYNSANFLLLGIG